MAYTPVGWQTGDTITADRLNKMDRGWGYESTQLFSETVTTADQGGMNRGQLAYSDDITADSISVTFDGTEYACPRIDAFDEYYYGGFSEQGPTFTEYPFVIASANGANTIYTETASTHTVSVTALAMQTSADFDAVRGYGYRDAELFSETVTTEVSEFCRGTLEYSEIINDASITVAFDGIEYECERIDEFGEYFYGGFDSSGPVFTTYPFAIESDPNSGANRVYTETAGTYDIAVEGSAIFASEDFGKAVNSCIDSQEIPYLRIDVLDSSTVLSWDEIHDAFINGYICVVRGYGPVLQMWSMGNPVRLYMATGGTAPQNQQFDPAIWRTPGSSSDVGVAFYKYNSQMP